MKMQKDSVEKVSNSTKCPHDGARLLIVELMKGVAGSRWAVTALAMGDPPKFPGKGCGFNCGSGICSTCPCKSA